MYKTQSHAELRERVNREKIGNFIIHIHEMSIMRASGAKLWKHNECTIIHQHIMWKSCTVCTPHTQYVLKPFAEKVYDYI